MTLTWLEISQRWPDCCVPWDRDVAPGLDWEVRFHERDGVLWADCEADHGKFPISMLRAGEAIPSPREVTYCDPCRCLVWIDDAWISHRAFDLRQLAIDAKRLSENLSAEFGSDPIVWRREYLGQWAEPQRPVYDRVLDHVARLLNRRTNSVELGVQNLIGEYARHTERGSDRDVDRVGRWIAYRITQIEGRPNSNVLPI